MLGRRPLSIASIVSCERFARVLAEMANVFSLVGIEEKCLIAQ
jgi:hypothetical protein